MLLLFQGLEDDLHATADNFAAGAITADEFGDHVYSYLLPAHIHATYIGRGKTGLTHPQDGDDVAFGTEAAEGEQEYLSRFVQDLKDGRYNKEAHVPLKAPPAPPTQPEEPAKNIDIEAIKARLTLYAMGIAATANEAWTEALPDDTWYDWVDVRDEVECSDCLKNARKGPYPRHDLPSIPGDGQTQCLRNCRCQLVISGTGKRSFDLRHLFDGAALIHDEDI